MTDENGVSAGAGGGGIPVGGAAAGEPGGGPLVARIAMVVLLAVAAVPAFAFSALQVFASDACADGDTAGICSVFAQNFVVVFPGIAVPLLFLTGAIAQTSRRRWLPVGLLCLLGMVLVVVVSSAVAS